MGFHGALRLRIYDLFLCYLQFASGFLYTEEVKFRDLEQLERIFMKNWLQDFITVVSKWSYKSSYRILISFKKPGNYRGDVYASYSVFNSVRLIVFLVMSVDYHVLCKTNRYHNIYDPLCVYNIHVYVYTIYNTKWQIILDVIVHPFNV